MLHDDDDDDDDDEDEDEDDEDEDGVDHGHLHIGDKRDDKAPLILCRRFSTTEPSSRGAGGGFSLSSRCRWVLGPSSSTVTALMAYAKRRQSDRAANILCRPTFLLSQSLGQGAEAEAETN